MRPFRSRLETVRRLRDHAEQRARDELARELTAHASVSDDLRRSLDAVDSAHRGARDADILARASWQAFIERRSREQRLIEAELQHQQQRVEEQRHALGRASREHQVIVKLEDKQRRRHRDDWRRRDESELSDIAGQAHRRALGGAA